MDWNALYTELSAMKAKKHVRIIVMLLILSAAVGCDQISKNAVRNRVGYHEQIDLIDDFLTLTRVENTGAFLSMGDSLPKPIKLVLLSVVPVLLLMVVLVFAWIKKSTSEMTLLGTCFIAGGGVGNIYDRLIYGSVTDFLHMDFVIFQTGIFNMADVSIMAGFCIVLIESWLTRKKIARD
jgi:signal peptidase II